MRPQIQDNRHGQRSEIPPLRQVREGDENYYTTKTNKTMKKHIEQESNRVNNDNAEVTLKPTKKHRKIAAWVVAQGMKDGADKATLQERLDEVLLNAETITQEEREEVMEAFHQRAGHVRPDGTINTGKPSAKRINLMRAKAQIAYEEGEGPSEVYKLNEHEFKLPYRYCEPCQADTPDLYGECLVCGTKYPDIKEGRDVA